MSHTCRANQKLVLSKHIPLQCGGQAVQQALYITASLLLLLSEDRYSWVGADVCVCCKCKTKTQLQKRC